MSSIAPRMDLGFGTCGRCGQWTQGRWLRFGIVPRARAPRDGILLEEEFFLCRPCERRLVWLGVRKQLFNHALVVAALPAAFVAVGITRGHLSQRERTDLITAGAGVLVALSWFLLRWRRARGRVVRELLFGLRRGEIAKRLGRPASSVRAVALEPRDGAAGR